jgi:hypothetical protein
MNPVEYHLKLTIYLWCGAKPAQYSIDSHLSDIWTAQVPGLAYDTVGVQKFMQTMYQDALFGPCPAAHNMTPGEFLKGGDLQTVKSVYVRLIACGTVGGAASITAEVGQPWQNEAEQDA